MSQRARTVEPQRESLLSLSRVTVRDMICCFSVMDATLLALQRTEDPLSLSTHTARTRHSSHLHTHVTTSHHAHTSHLYTHITPRTHVTFTHTRHTTHTRVTERWKAREEMRWRRTEMCDHSQQDLYMCVHVLAQFVSFLLCMCVVCGYVVAFDSEIN